MMRSTFPDVRDVSETARRGDERDTRGSRAGSRGNPKPVLIKQAVDQ